MFFFDKPTDFSQILLTWFDPTHRPLPWKGENDPYLIWLSEIILQQTRAEQGLPYFERFKQRYPTVQDLALATDDEVMKLWEGLGYYSRARNLLQTARFIVERFNGVFPNDYPTIRSLKGVGDYTAAAIASFAFGLPYAVVDGNVYRVLARIFAIETPTDTTQGKKLFADLAQQLLDPDRPADFNQAMMDFGATLCTPHFPQCAICPFKNYCRAFYQQKIDSFPVKSKKIQKKERYFNFLVIKKEDYFFIQQRMEKDIWQNLYQFPLLETPEMVNFNTLTQHQAWFLEKNWTRNNTSTIYRQTLTHQRINAIFYQITVGDDFLIKNQTWKMVKQTDLCKFAFPKIIDLYLNEKSLFLELF